MYTLYISVYTCGQNVNNFEVVKWFKFKKKNDPQGLLCSDDELVHSPNYTKLLKHVHVVKEFWYFGLGVFSES